jgi:hypothetical protein
MKTGWAEEGEIDRRVESSADQSRIPMQSRIEGYDYLWSHGFVNLSLRGIVGNRSAKLSALMVTETKRSGEVGVEHSSRTISSVLDKLHQMSAHFSKVHAESKCPHKARIAQESPAQNGMTMTVHPSYSTDLAPSHFYLFSHAKVPLRGESFEAGEDCLSAIQRMLGTFEKSTLSPVFLE